MKVTGIIVEYNPFHNGHVLHIEETRKITGCDYLIAVMSGNFVQRGEPAFINKWARTRMALEAGIDLVLELPMPYSISSAEGFAFGAVSTLDSLGIVDSICFGSEHGEVETLYILAKLLLEEPEGYKNCLKSYLGEGISYPSARQKAIEKYLVEGGEPAINPSIIPSILSSSNNILAIEYIKSILKLGSNIVPYTLRRVGNNYNDACLTGSISSATSIRSNLLQGNSVNEALPHIALDIILDEINSGRGPVTLEGLSDVILYKIRNSSPDLIRDILEVNEGIEYKIKEAAENSGSVQELISSVKNKRYTSTRIQRTLIYILLGITKKMAAKIQLPPSYIRVLGFNHNGRKLIRNIKENCSIPVITNPSRKDIELLRLDIEATDTYVLGYTEKKYKFARQDLKKTPIIKAFP